MNKGSWLKDYTNRHGFDDIEGNEKWDQKIMYNQKERAKMILKSLDEEPELEKEFYLLLRQKKLNKIKKNV